MSRGSRRIFVGEFPRLKYLVPLLKYRCHLEQATIEASNMIYTKYRILGTVWQCLLQVYSINPQWKEHLHAKSIATW